MTLHLTRPLVFLDLEATGTNPQTDRIVECAFRRISPTNAICVFTTRINPGLPIPADATAVHGITDADVAGKPTFAAMLRQVSAICEDADLCGYNALRFDIPLLIAEFARAGSSFSLEGRRIIDPQVIFFRREPRDLSEAFRRFCGVEHTGAHGAHEDALATEHVLHGMLREYKDLGADVESLHTASMEGREDFIDFEGKLRFDADGDAVLAFGKHRTRKLREVDQDYLRWALRQEFPADAEAIFRDALKGKFPRRSQPTEASR